MKNFQKLMFTIFSGIILFSFTSAETVNYKCLVQLENYNGYGAYIVVSVVDEQGNYEETLQVFGDDREWYPDLEAWWMYRRSVKQQPNLDAITGASVLAGDREMFVLNINKNYLDNGYFLRFETGVEDKEYHKQDVELPLHTKDLKGKIEGSGFIRYVRLIESK